MNQTTCLKALFPILLASVLMFAPIPTLAQRGSGHGSGGCHGGGGGLRTAGGGFDGRSYSRAHRGWRRLR
jgi:hypothetical protein